jgi:outer membrane protein insertion porin family
VTLRAPIRHIEWEGEPGIGLAAAVAAAGLAIGEEASPERLARAERDLLARYRQDGYLAARVRFQIQAVPGTSERDVTVFLDAGGPTKIGTVRLVGDTGLPAAQIEKVLKLEEGERYRESRMRDGIRAAEERLRQEGYYGARVTARPDWRPEGNRVDLEIAVTAGPRYQIKFAGRSALSESTLKSRLTFPEIGSADAFEQEASAHRWRRPTGSTDTTSPP